MTMVGSQAFLTLDCTHCLRIGNANKRNIATVASIQNRNGEWRGYPEHSGEYRVQMPQLGG